MIRRNISKITQNHWHNGFLGTGHRAMAVLDGVPYKDSDPFILFMDDSLNLPGGEPVGGAHPHAGFETLSLVLEGNEKDWKTGSFELMTAGKGIIHTEEITSKQKLRMLQVWLVLPPEKRYAQPFLQRMLLEDVPKIKTDTYEIRVYSGSSNGLTSPLKNHTPFTLVDFRLEEKAVVTQEIPSHYNGLVYVLKGSVKAGDKIIKAEQAGWLEKITENGESELQFEALVNDTHFVLYAGQPHNVPVVHHGPFVADTMEDIAQMYRDFRYGKFPHLNDLPSIQKTSYSSQISN
ncbi:pirin family protein [Parapedobacter soli]|uniref:pirin family protein n=1 Tax=Parapedobacter soli TaxID=416955 RepID=UPI0021CA996C|nr:pirin-like C-terminal cupin domain-containing protein [Parapedobacter soli]